jgi:hypothetical protein
MRVCDNLKKVARKLYPILMRCNPIPAEAGLDAANWRTLVFDTVRKRLLHSKGSHWTRGCLVVRTLGLFKFSRQVEPTTTLDPFRQSARHPHPSRT